MPPAPASPADIPALVRRLRSGSKAAQAEAAIALAGFSEDAAHCPALVAAGAMPAAVRLLRKGGNADGEQAALIVIGNLACDSRDCAAAAAAAGAPPLMIERVKRSGRAEVQRSAVLALGNVALCEPGRQAVLAAGGVAVLLQALQRGGAPLWVPVASALTSLLRGDVPAADLRAAVPALLRLLRCPDIKAQEEAAGALSNAALLGDEARAGLAAMGAVPALLGQLSGSRSWWAALWAALRAALWWTKASPNADAAMQALGHLAIGRQQRAAILAEGHAGLAFFAALRARGDDVMRGIAERGLAEAAAAAAAAQPAAAGDEQQAAGGPRAAPPAGEDEAAQAGQAEAAEGAGQPRKACAACGATSGLRRCKACRTVRYCGAACQAEHWQEHRAECWRLQAERAAAGLA